MWMENAREREREKEIVRTITAPGRENKFMREEVKVKASRLRKIQENLQYLYFFKLDSWLLAKCYKLHYEVVNSDNDVCKLLTIKLNIHLWEDTSEYC